MVTTRSTKLCQRVVESGVGSATDFENGIKVGNANGTVRSKKSCKKKDRAHLQEEQQEKAEPLMRKREGGSMAHNIAAGAPENAEPSQTRNVKKLARNLKLSQNSGSGMTLDKKSLDLSNSCSDCDTMKSCSPQVHGLVSDECQIDQNLVPNSLHQTLKSGRKIRLARRSNTEFNVTHKDEGTLGEPLKAKPKRRKQRIKRADLVAEDSLSKFRRLVKHSFNRMKMEQNLIEAYSGEGWKGLSREKIRPEKELQRAEAQILKCKFAIREVIHDLCLKCLEGSIQDSAFDGEGQIPVDEIFCAKCLSPEEYANNDIILCDGACNRAFHQYCLEPPLAAHDIPPDDEGWLCPVCDCKLDCLDLISDFMEEDFELDTSWEQIYPEADPTTHTSLEALGDRPSDDSEDDDFDPDQLDARKVITEGDNQLDSEGSSSCSSSSSDSSGSKEQSEPNSEDDDSLTSEDKRKPVHTVQRKRENITSSVGDDHENDDLVVSERRQRMEVDYKKLNDEMFGKEEGSEVESSDDEWGPRKRSKQKPEISQTDVASVKKPSGNKRSAEGAAKTGIRQSKAAAQRRKTSVDRKKEKEVATLENTQMSIQKSCGKEESDNRENSNGSEPGSRKRRKQKPDVVASDVGFRSPSCYNKSSDDSTKVEIQQPKLVSRNRNTSAAGKKVGKTAAKQESAQTLDMTNRSKIPEMAVQRLKGAFTENTMPSKSYKEGLSKELGLSYERVCSWFKSQRKYLALKKRRSLTISPLQNTAGSPKSETADLKDQVFLQSVLQEPDDVNKGVEKH